MGILIACLLYLFLPTSILIFIGILNPTRNYHEIVGHLLLLCAGILSAYFLKNLWGVVKEIRVKENQTINVDDILMIVM